MHLPQLAEKIKESWKKANIPREQYQKTLWNLKKALKNEKDPALLADIETLIDATVLAQRQTVIEEHKANAEIAEVNREIKEREAREKKSYVTNEMLLEAQTVEIQRKDFFYCQPEKHVFNMDKLPDGYGCRINLLSGFFDMTTPTRFIEGNVCCQNGMNKEDNRKYKQAFTITCPAFNRLDLREAGFAMATVLQELDNWKVVDKDGEIKRKVKIIDFYYSPKTGLQIAAESD